MARRFLDDIRADITADLADNSTGDISPADIRLNLIDMCDSLASDEAGLASSVETTGIALTGTFANLATVYSSGTGDDGDFLNVNVGNGTVTGTATAGFSYQLLGTLVIEAGNNEVVELAFGSNGVVVGGVVTIIGDGSNDASRSWAAFIQSAPSSGVFSIMARAQDGSATIDVVSARFVVSILPTNNA